VGSRRGGARGAVAACVLGTGVVGATAHEASLSHPQSLDFRNGKTALCSLFASQGRSKAAEDPARWSLHAKRHHCCIGCCCVSGSLVVATAENDGRWDTQGLVSPLKIWVRVARANCCYIPIFPGQEEETQPQNESSQFPIADWSQAGEHSDWMGTKRHAAKHPISCRTMFLGKSKVEYGNSGWHTGRVCAYRVTPAGRSKKKHQLSLLWCNSDLRGRSRADSQHHHARRTRANRTVYRREHPRTRKQDETKERTAAMCCCGMACMGVACMRTGSCKVISVTWWMHADHDTQLAWTPY